ncbi:MAG: BadF/BadG/BcrA/BcrD ATPase family protein [Rhodoferax sp.]
MSGTHAALGATDSTAPAAPSRARAGATEATEGGAQQRIAPDGGGGQGGGEDWARRFSALPSGVDYAVGVDGGGTSTRARVWHRSGTLVGEGRAGPSGLMQGQAQAWRHIGQAIAQACTGRVQRGWAAPTPAHCALGLGLAGANHAPWVAEFLAADPGYARCVLRSDAQTALSGAHGGAPGVLVILGTGAIALARGHDGQERWVSGWGFPSGDEGAGADLGLRAVRATQQALDGRSPPSPLTEAVLQHCGGSAAALLAWSCQAQQHEFASLAPLVFEHAGHDPLARELRAHALHQLERLLRSANPGGDLPAVVAGGIGQRLLPLLGADLARSLVAPQGDAMDGALALCFLSSSEPLSQPLTAHA